MQLVYYKGGNALVDIYRLREVLPGENIKWPI